MRHAERRSRKGGASKLCSKFSGRANADKETILQSGMICFRDPVHQFSLTGQKIVRKRENNMGKKATIAQRAGKVASLLKMRETPVRKSLMVMVALGLLSVGATAPAHAQVTSGATG